MFYLEGNDVITTTMDLGPQFKRTGLTPPAQANDALSRDLSRTLSQYRELRLIGCEYIHGTLILHGTVSSYYLKQICQEALRSTAAELQATIDNRLLVSEL
jgi:2'-5' RNA ligase